MYRCISTSVLWALIVALHATITTGVAGAEGKRPEQPALSLPDADQPAWAEEHLHDDPLAGKERVTYEDLVQALHDPARRDHVLLEHFYRADGLTDQQRRSLLQSALTNESRQVQVQAAVELQRLGLLQEVVRLRLEKLATQDPDRGVRQAGKTAVARFELPEAGESDTDALVAHLTAASDVERLAAERRLEAMGPAAVPALLRALGSDDPALRKAAALLISRIVNAPRQPGAAAAAPPTDAGPQGAPAKSMFGREAKASVARIAETQKPVPVRVFYGTNRQRRVESARSIRQIVLWAAACALLTGWLIWRRRRPRRAPRGEAAAAVRSRSRSLGMTAVLLVLLLAAGWQLNLAVQRQMAYHTGVRFGPSHDERGVVHYGYCDVTLPPTHRTGQLNRPLLGPEDERRHVVLRRTVETNEQIFFDAIRSELANREIESRECFVFVHGYNVTFEAAALRTAQITYDLRTVGGYHGVPLLFSWPSAGNQLAYSWDRTEIAHSKDPLKEFLLDVTGRSGAASVNVLAHSMGADAVARAIADIDGDETVFNQVILAAPDIDAYVFERELLPKIAKKAVRTTVYCSSNDLALHASYCFNNAHRVGDSSRGLIVLKDMDTVDASQVRTDLLGHSYYGDCLELAADIGVLLRTNTAPDAQERHLLRRQLHNLAYWVFGKP